MTDVKQFFTGDAAELIPRDRWGRPQIKQADGKLKAYQRCTTFVGPLEDTSNLTKWKMRQALKGVMSRPALQMAVASSLDDDRKLNKIAEDCLDAAGSSDKATLGTALHKFTEDYDNHLDISAMPPLFRPDLDAYAKATSIFEMAAIEQFVVVDELAVAGTADRIIKYQGQYFIGDVKTGSIEYGMGKICMQLATYAHGKAYNPETGERIDLPPVSQTAGIIIHLPAGTGTCELVWCDLAAGWSACTDLAVGVQAWRKRKDLFKKFTAPAAQVEGQTVAELPAPVPVVEPVAQTVPVNHFPGTQAAFNAFAGEISAALLSAIAQARSLDELNQIYSLNQTVWRSDHSAAATARKKELEVSR